MKTALAILLGFAIGVATMLFLEPVSGEAELTHVQTKLATSEATVATLTEQLASTRSKVESARKEIRSSQRTHTKADPTPTPSSNPSFTDAAIQSAMSMMETESETKRIALTTRLNLTPDQQTRLADYLKSEQLRSAEMTTRMLSGEPLSDADLTAASHESEADFMKKLLTPEQLAGYNAYEEEKENDTLQFIAQHDLSGMSAMFQLTEDQKDAAFAILVEARDLDQPAPDSVPTDLDTTDFLVAEQDRRVAFLRERLPTVLPQSDVDLWLEQEAKSFAAQQEMMKQFMNPKSDSRQ